MKYIIELEKIKGTDLYRAVGANTLVFDDYGIANILKPLEPELEKAYKDGIALGREDALNKHDGCDGCRYEDVDPKKEPCSKCKGNYLDRYELAKTRGIDWNKVPKDTKVYVWLSASYKENRYFSHFDDGTFYTFKDGQTSWTTYLTTAWTYCQLAEPAKEEWYK